MQMSNLSLGGNYTISRLKRSAKQNIKLISMDEGPCGPIYTVYGSTGSKYTIKTHPSMNCTCIDFKKNNRYCKHIYFIFLNVYKTIPNLNKLYTLDELKELHTNFYNLTKPTATVRDDSEPCSICFECISSPLVCKVCKHGFHEKCIHEMIKFSGKSNCPLCRSLFVSEIDDLIKQVEML
jgi:hypothetical protein